MLSSDYAEIGRPDAISFLDLVDVVLVNKLRGLGVSMPTIRKAYDALGTLLRTDHPFSRKELLCDEKGRLFVRVAEESAEVLVEIIKHQHAFPSILMPYLKTIEFDPESRFASRLAPMSGVVIDPMRRYGKPIVASSGMSTAILDAAYRANGEDSVAVAAWYDVTPEDVELAHRFESTFAGLAA